MKCIPLLIGFICSVALVKASASEQPRILVLMDRGFNNTEFYQGTLPLIALGYAVEVASPEGGIVFRSNDAQADDRGRDWQADLSLDEVNPERYVGLFIPGGHSPGHLEQHARAIAISREIMQRDIPVAAVCHGPRLLLRAGVLHDRVVTSLFRVPNEAPQEWRDGAMGTYIDQAVVRDRTLVTARYPGDMTAFINTFIDVLTQENGLPSLNKVARLALVVDGLDNQHQRWAMLDAPRVLGSETREIRTTNHLNALLSDGDWQPDVVVVFPGSQFDRDDLSQLPGKLMILDEQEHYSAHLPLLGDAIRVHGSAREDTPAPPPADALIAIAPGFDDAAVAGLQAVLATRGHRVALVAEAEDAGWVRGLHGLTLWADDRHQVARKQEALIVAPGGFWPMADSRARQTDDPPAWLHEQEQRDQARIKWLQERYADGDTLVLIGMDALRVGRGNEAFAGLRFASSQQTRWGFGRNGARFSSDPARKSAERLFTAQGAAAIPELIALMDQANDEAE
ncbi:MAG: hypothetical protein EA401_10695 [Planctomycetota bacterium]|nr:MAG: hypothetical protein EA401_10695 [Planctomycetota bacterium]